VILPTFEYVQGCLLRLNMRTCWS